MTAAARPFPSYLPELLDRAAMLQRAHFATPGPVHLRALQGDDECPCLASLEWPWDQPGDNWAPVLVITSECTGAALCRSLPGLPCSLAAEPAAPAADAPATASLARTLARAAGLLQVQAHASPVVPFTWWAEGESRAYLSRLEWVPSAGALSLVLAVYRGLTGDLVCRSMPGRLFEIEPASFNAETPATDEVDRAMALRS